MKLLATFTFFFAFINISLAQVSEEWVRRYNGPGNSFDVASKLYLDSQGNVYVSGSSVGTGTFNDFIVLKYNNAGSQQWAARFDHAGRSDELRTSAFDSTGNVYGAGFSTDSLNNIYFTVIKVNSSGAVVWSKLFYFPGYPNTYAQSICIDHAGNIIIAGTGTSEASKQRILLLKIDPSGSEIWRTVYSSSTTSNDLSTTVGVDNSNMIYLAGSSEPGTLLFDYVLLKYSSSGSRVWERRYGGPATDDKPYAMTIDGANNIIVTGSSSFASSSADYTTIKYNGSGDSLWVKKYDGGGSFDIPFTVITDEDNKVYITGSSRSGTSLGSEDIATIKYSPLGNVEWLARFNGAANGSDIGYGLVTDPDHNVYIAGSSDTGNFHMVYALVKYNSLGDFKWLRTYSVSPTTPEDFAYTAALDKQNNIFVTGISFDNVTDYDITTIKYSQSIGIDPISNELPKDHKLYQNFPNPFNPETVIAFDLPVSSNVSLMIYDTLGKVVGSYINSGLKVGKYEFKFNGSSLPSGIYFYRLIADNYTDIRKMILTK